MALDWPIVKRKNSRGYEWAGTVDAAWEWTHDRGFPELQMDPGALDDDEVRQAITASERMGDQVSAALGMSRVSLLARLVLAAYEGGSYLILESEDGRFVHCTVFRAAGKKVAEISYPEPRHAPDSTGRRGAGTPCHR